MSLRLSILFHQRKYSFKSLVIFSFIFLSPSLSLTHLIEVCPTITVDNTAGLTLYLSNDCLDKTKVYTSKSTEMNILCKTPEMKEEDDLLELAIPEQFETLVLPNGSLVTQPVQHI